MTAVAAGEGAAVFVTGREAFAALLSAHPEIAGGVIRLLAVQNRRLTEMLKAQALHSVRARFAAYLLAAAGAGDTFALPDTNAGIAAHLGTVREVVSRTLHAFADAGAITVRGRTITLLNRTALTNDAAPPP